MAASFGQIGGTIIHPAKGSERLWGVKIHPKLKR